MTCLGPETALVQVIYSCNLFAMSHVTCHGGRRGLVVRALDL